MEAIQEQRKDWEPAEPYVSPTLASPYDVTSDVAGLKTIFVNVFFIGEQQPGGRWVLGYRVSPGKSRQRPNRCLVRVPNPTPSFSPTAISTIPGP